MVRTGDIQWEANIQFSYLGHKHVAELRMGPFPDLEELMVWQFEFMDTLTSLCGDKKGLSYEIHEQRVQEIVKQEVFSLILKKPSWLARSIVSNAIRELASRVIP